MGFTSMSEQVELSEAQLTLNSLVDITDKESFNINVLSHLEKERIGTLLTNGMTFEKLNFKLRLQDLLS